jgi:hypothetical protein
MGFRAILHLCLFVLAFTLEIRIAKAGSESITQSKPPKQDAILQEPRGCLENKVEPCALKSNSGQKFELNYASAHIVMDHSTALILTQKGVVLVDGTVWVRTDRKVNVKTEFGYAEVSNAEAWISRSEKRMTVSVISNSVELYPRGAAEPLVINSGLENYMGGVEKDGSAETGLPVAIGFSEHIERWARLFSGTKAQFESQVAAFHSTWVEAAQEAADVHQALLGRKVASVKAEEDLKAAKRAKIEQENRELRDLFRKKIFDGL